MERKNFVARTEELSRLDGLLSQSTQKSGKICFVSGEAGAGKTALVSAFSEQALKDYKKLIVAIGSCSSHHGISDPYLPFKEILALLTGDTDGSKKGQITSKESTKRLKGLLRVSGQAIVELGPDLLDIFVPGSGIITRAGVFLAEKAGWLKTLESIEKRKKANPQVLGKDPTSLIEQYSNVLAALAKKHPLLIAIDDLQWADPSSLNLLFYLSKHIEESRILIIGTYRPEEIAVGRNGKTHPLKPVLGDLKRYFGDIIIDLDQPESMRQGFVRDLLDVEPNKLDDHFCAELLQHTSGHALFTIELLKEMRERGDLQKDTDGFWYKKRGFSWDKLPTRIEGVIETRLDRLDSEELQLLRTASVEGEVFTGEVLANIHDRNPADVISQLSRTLSDQHELIHAEGFQSLNEQGISRYRFRHALFQIYLYSELDEAERVYLHRAVGNALEGIYGKKAEDISIQLSHHFAESRDYEKAVKYALISGNKAHGSSAYREAIDAFKAGLELAGSISERSTRDLMELMLYLALGNSISATEGAADGQVQDTYNKAIAISNEVVDTPQSFLAIRGLSYHHKMRGDFEKSRTFERKLLQMAENLQDPVLLTEAHRLIAESFIAEGEFTAGCEHYEHATNYYEKGLHQKFISMLGVDSGQIAFSQKAYFTWSLGYPDQAVAIGEEVLQDARELNHPFSLAITLDNISALYHQLREPQACFDVAKECCDLSAEYGFVMWNSRAQMRQGWAQAMLGDLDEGIELIELGFETFIALGNEISLPCLSALLAEALFTAQQYEESIMIISKAIETITRINDRYCEAEIYRIQGDNLAKMKNYADAESAYRTAIKVARTQKARSLELRALIHLVKFLQNQPSLDNDLLKLKYIFEEFKEGFNTADLIEAQALMDNQGINDPGRPI